MGNMESTWNQKWENGGIRGKNNIWGISPKKEVMLIYNEGDIVVI